MRGWRVREVALAATMLCCVAACSTGEAAVDAVGEPPTEAALSEHGVGSPTALRGSGPWTATASGGAHVTVRLLEGPAKEGPVRLAISVHSSDEETRPLSIDYVSPTMPMHGVMRAPVHVGQDGSFRATAQIPMGGLWALYVNLDEGADAAEFLLEVLNADGSSGHDHSAMEQEPTAEAAAAHDHSGH